MIPSLVAGEVRTGIVEYLTTTFALSDDETRLALSSFLQDPEDGIFRGPFLRVRPPFQQVDPDWKSPLEFFPKEWQADGIRPHRHQGLAWERLAGRTRLPEPTILTTGTGSGKTEGFEIPILDHVIWAREQQIPGVKALVLYPMNALASDQASRFAERIAGDDRLAGIRVGLFVGLEPDAETAKAMTAASVITDQSTLLDDPPEVLLTNYKMLDRLLTTPDRTRLWAANTPESLRYIVLDEFHTYDGAQGTDVAMLLRRLGARLAMADLDPSTGRHRPLGSCAAVGTSATLGSTDAARADLRGFAEKVFGCEFPDDAVITESRRSVEDSTPNPSVFAMPDPLIVAKLHNVEDHELVREVAGMFLGEACPATSDGEIDLFALGEKIAAHHLMRPLLTICGSQPIRWSQVAAKMAERDAGWAKTFKTDPEAVEAALAWFVALVSKARRTRLDKDGNPKTRADGSLVEAELFSVEVQLWIREVSRLLRQVEPSPAFRWFDSGVVPDVGEAWLPSVFCRHCGRSGWAAKASDKPRLIGCVGDRLSQNPQAAYQASMERSELFRAMIHASPLEEEVAWLDPDSGQLFPTENAGFGTERSPVLVMEEQAGAAVQRCPSCDNDDAIRFLGSAVTSLASVTVSQLFGSQMVQDNERKLIAFADSVQDAAHRAGFFTGRAHKFNLRSLVAGAAKDAGGPVSVIELTAAVIKGAPDAVRRFQVLPPDMHNSVAAKSLLTDSPTAEALEMLERRVRLEVDLEFGLRSRVGRTIELTGAAVAHVEADEAVLIQIADGLREYHLHHIGEQQTLNGTEESEEDKAGSGLVLEPATWNVWLRGLLDRARSRGAIAHPWFLDYWRDQNPYLIWGGREEGMSAFPQGFSRPKPPSLSAGGPKRVYDRIGAGSWFENWTTRVLGIDKSDAIRLVKYAFEELADHGVVSTVQDKGGEPFWLLPPERVVLVDVVDANSAHRELVCDVCNHRHPTPGHLVDLYDRAPCLRWRCPGRFNARAFDLDNYYRGFYRDGRMRRVVATPHTGMLTHDERVKIETEFKGTVEPLPPDAPNVLTATPTLEMGIDIGDLSAVMLTSIPRKQAAHAQRIGRAGRKSGNSLVTTFAETDPMSLYYLTEPELMLSGEIRPPDCYLDANEILARHFLGYVVDRSADGTFNAGATPGRAKQMFDGFGKGGWLDLILHQAETDPTMVGGFLELFTGTIDPDVEQWVRAYAAAELRHRIGNAVSRWRDEYAEHGRRAKRIGDAVKILNDKTTRTAEEEKQLSRLRGERGAIQGLMKSIREATRLNTLENLGLLPNYTLTEDTVTFNASLWWLDEKDDYQVKEMSLDRAASQAVTEFAPGAAFYGGAYKLRVDTLDIGTRSEPLYERHRLCPECAYGEPFKQGAAVSHCPRCGTSKIADDLANVHSLLRLRSVSCTQSEVESRIYDDTDSREQVAFDTITTVDIDPEAIKGTWKHDREAFAFEYTNHALIRTVNAGREDRSGLRTDIAGTPINASWFRVCRSCGIVAGVRRQDRATGMEAHHGYCSAKKGDTDEIFDPIGLYNQTDTEAVRILLPVHDMESDERVASFKATLMLGLRLSFGGDPDHLRILDTTHPTADPDQRQRLLIVHDTVTGGTGYVKRLADPEQMRKILVDARTAISTCVCRTEGKPACHRCLLGTTRKRDVPLVSRQAALDVLGPILDEWSGKPMTSDVTGIDVSGVRQSELEQRFKRLLHKLEGRKLSNGVTCQVTATPAGNNKSTFDVRLAAEAGTTTRWKISEQVLMSTTPHTIADFVATRLDQTGFPDVVIYLDGFQFHATATHNRLDGDTERRDALRTAGKIVWQASWTDILDVEKAWGENPQPPGRSRAWPTGVTTRAETLFPGTKERVAGNPFLTLLDFLADPDMSLWRSTARFAFLGWYRAANDGVAGWTLAKTVADPQNAIELWVDGEAIEVDGTASTVAIETRSDGGLPVAFSCETPPTGSVHAAVRLPASPKDLTSPDHRLRWIAWLHLGNTLQFLDNEGSSHTISTSSAPNVGPSSTQTGSTTGTVGTVDLAKTIVAEDVLAIATAAVAGGAPSPSGGWEPDPNPDGHLVEAAWPKQRIGILDPDPNYPQPGIAKWAEDNDWELRMPEAWTAQEIIELTKDTK